MAYLVWQLTQAYSDALLYSSILGIGEAYRIILDSYVIGVDDTALRQQVSDTLLHSERV